MGQSGAYLQPGKRDVEEGKGNGGGGVVEGARKRGRWELSILDNSRILLAGILGSLLHKDHSLPLLQRTQFLSCCLSPLFSLPLRFFHHFSLFLS